MAAMEAVRSLGSAAMPATRLCALESLSCGNPRALRQSASGLRAAAPGRSVVAQLSEIESESPASYDANSAWTADLQKAGQSTFMAGDRCKPRKPLTATKRAAMLGYLICLAAGPIASSSQTSSSRQRGVVTSTSAAAPQARELFSLASALPQSERKFPPSTTSDNNDTAQLATVE